MGTVSRVGESESFAREQVGAGGESGGSALFGACVHMCKLERK